MADVNTDSPLPPQPTAPGSLRKRRLWRPMILMIVVVLVIVAIIVGVKFTQISALIAQSKIPCPPPWSPPCQRSSPTGNRVSPPWVR